MCEPSTLHRAAPVLPTHVCTHSSLTHGAALKFEGRKDARRVQIL